MQAEATRGAGARLAGEGMARRRARVNNGTVPGWGNKSLPPEFLARRRQAGAGHGWWSGLTWRGQGLILVAVLCLAAVIVVLSISFTGNSTSSTAVKPHKPVTRPPRAVTKPPRLPVVRFPRLSENAARVELVFLTSGLHFMLENVSSTSSSLLRDLEATFGAPTSSHAGFLASLDVVADGPEGPPSDGNTSAPGSALADRYLSIYHKYLDRVTLIRQLADSAPVIVFAVPKQRRRLVRATDDLSRDISVIIAGLERLRAPGDEDISSVVRGIEDSITRIEEESDRVDRLLEDLGRKK
jgi:hypothetical protein